MGERADKKLKIFEPFLKEFESDELRSYCSDMIVRIPDSVWAYEKGDFMISKLECCMTINRILKLGYIQHKIEKPKKRDCIRIAMCFYNIHEDKAVVTNWIKYTKVQHEIKQGLKDYISDLVFLDTSDEAGLLLLLCDATNNNKIPFMVADEIREIAIPDPETYFFDSGDYKNMNFFLVLEMDREYLVKIKNEGNAQEPLKTYLDEYLD